MKTAEKIGEDLYSFKPTPEVRSVSGVLGHVADGNRLLCRIASGENVDFDKIMKDVASVQVHEKKTAKPSSSPRSTTRGRSANQSSPS